MSEIVPLPSGSLPRAHTPQAFHDTQAKLTAIIDYAAKIEAWPVLEEAVDAKIEDQAWFLAWWDRNVRPTGRPFADVETALIPRDDAESQTRVSHQQVARWRKSLASRDRYRASILLAAYRKANLSPNENHRAEGTGENEWFTPERYIAAARSVMGGIDWDPATHPQAQQTIQAKHFATRQDNGLAMPWHGRVWLNPPYAQPLIAQFIEKLLTEWTTGDVTEAILLTHNYTDTAWFHLAEASAVLLCFTRGRIRFLDPDGDECAPTQGQTFFYYGQDHRAFRAAFTEFGFVR